MPILRDANENCPKPFSPYCAQITSSNRKIVVFSFAFKGEKQYNKIMQPINLLNAKKRMELRQWLAENHSKEKECWVVVKRGKPINDAVFWYIDAVEEAMCFGWIDSTTKRLSNGVTAQKLAPRRKNSVWSELNKERCRRLEKLGYMTDYGRAVLPNMSPSGFIIDSDILTALQADKTVWNNFVNFPPLYQRVRIDTIQIKKKEPQLFKSRLRKFIENTRQNIMFGEWNDNGRLLDY